MTILPSWKQAPVAVFEYSQHPESLGMHYSSIEKGLLNKWMKEYRSDEASEQIREGHAWSWKYHSNLGRWEMLQQHTEMLMSTDYIFQHLLWKISRKASMQSSPCPQLKPAPISVVALFICTPTVPRIPTTYGLFFRNTLYGPFSCQICFMTSFSFSFSFPFCTSRWFNRPGSFSYCS